MTEEIPFIYESEKIRGLTPPARVRGVYDGYSEEKDGVYIGTEANQLINMGKELYYVIIRSRHPNIEEIPAIKRLGFTVEGNMLLSRASRILLPKLPQFRFYDRRYEEYDKILKEAGI